MKFSHGMWLTHKGFDIRFPQQAYVIETTDRQMTLHAPFREIRRRGDTVDCGMMTIVLSSPLPNVICVKLQHHKGSRQKQAAFPLVRKSTYIDIFETDDAYVLSSGNAQARIGKARYDLSFYYGDRKMTQSAYNSAAYISHDDGRSFVRDALELSVGENIYGFGERFTPFVKNGQSVDIWNEDGGADSYLAYKNIPFYLSSAGYGVFVNHTGRVGFEVASEKVSQVQFSVPGEDIEYMVLLGNSLKSVVSAYTDLTGRPALPPAWSFGPWLSTSFTTDYSDETILHFVKTMQDKQIPLSVIHFDCFWMKGFEWTSFLWDKENFPDPAAMIRDLHANGLRVCLWINPYISQKSPLFEEGMENNFFINTGKGDVFQWDRWQPGMALVDFTNGHARAWYQKHLEELIKIGVDAFKTDFGERIPVQDDFYGQKAADEGISYHDGRTDMSMHNTYSLLYNQLVFEVLERKLGKGNACVFARAATVGCQKYPVHWGGDALSTYASMAATLRGGLSLGLCGFGFWSHDIGGFEPGCTPDLYKRWAQFGLMSTHSRFHGSSEYKVPWLYGEEAVDTVRLFARLKLGLMPYLYTHSVEATLTGIPVMRPMLLEFPDDPTCYTLDRQYMLGPSLLCAPIFNDQGRVTFYVPAGRWTNLITHEQINGPSWHTQTYDYDTMPLLCRDHTLLVTGKTDVRPDYNYLDSVTISLFALSDGHEAVVDVYADQGQNEGHVSAARKGRQLVIKKKGFSGHCRLMLSNVFHIGECVGGFPESAPWGTRITLDADTVAIELTSD